MRGGPVTFAHVGMGAAGLEELGAAPGGWESAPWEQPPSTSAPASTGAAHSARRAAGPTAGAAGRGGRGKAEGRGKRGGRIGFDIVQSSLFGAKALPGVRGRASTVRAKALSSG
ncbi:hypothetical protein GCM10009864_36500 [Streptomyces lunalinharesii]|uniref:Uncharacterized protein n=1 Tax=Streptomyces lunalinharesii TaxID=333384 RepID=A0ABN3RZN9_9ACTN